MFYNRDSEELFNKVSLILYFHLSKYFSAVIGSLRIFFEHLSVVVAIPFLNLMKKYQPIFYFGNGFKENL